MEEYTNLNPLYEMNIIDGAKNIYGKIHNSFVKAGKQATHNAYIGKGLSRLGAGLHDFLDAIVVTFTPPMPSMDIRVCKHICQWFKSIVQNKSASELSKAARYGRFISYPFKSSVRMFDRTVIGALRDMSALMIPGLYYGPNPFYGIAQDIPTKQLIIMLKDAIMAQKGAVRHYTTNAKTAIQNTANKIRRSIPQPSTSLDLMPSY